MVRFKRIMALTLVFLLLITGIDLTVFKEENTADASSNITYALVVGYFEYWKDSSGNYMYDDKDGVRHIMGKGDPNSYSVSNYTYPVATIGTTHKIKNIYSLPYYGGSWADLNYTALSENEVRNYYLDSAVVSNASHLIGTSQTQVMFTTSFYPRSTDTSKKITANKWRNYIAMVIEYEPANSATLTIQYKDMANNSHIRTQEIKTLTMNQNNTYPIPAITGYTKHGFRYNGGTINTTFNNITVYGSTGSHLVEVFYVKQGSPPPPDPPPPTDPDPEPPPIQGEVRADLKIRGQDTLYFNYKDFNNGLTETLYILADASGSTSVLRETYDFEVDVGNRFGGNKGRNNSFGWDYLFNKDNINVNNRVIYVRGFVEVEDDDGNKDTATDSKYVDVRFTNERPRALFNHPQRMYATVPFVLDDKSTDYEDEMKFKEWVIRDSSNNVVMIGKIFVENPDLNEVTFLSSSIDDAKISDSEIEITFNRKDNYRASLYVEDKGDPTLGVSSLNHTYTKILFVNSEPQPPVADFDRPEFGFANEPISVVDRSTDPNDDIVKWDWTKPPQGAGTLINSGGQLTFPSVGEYPVSLKVTDFTDLSDSITKMIKIIPPMPIAVISEKGTAKENRKLTIHSKDTLSPKVDPIQISRSEWTIEPLEGQSVDSIKIDIPESEITLNGDIKSFKGREETDFLFKEIGDYKVTLKVHNNFSDANPTHEAYSATYVEKIITITEDLPPIPDFTVDGASPNFFDNPLSTKVEIKGFAYSEDADIIAKYKYTIIRDNNENGNFDDEPIYAVYTNQNPSMTIFFEQGNSGAFKIIQEVTEEFGQATIPKFVTPDDRRKATLERIVHINWIPDISYNLPEFAYTDDTLTVITALKDEKIETLTVDWELKRAREGNTIIMDNVSFDDYTERLLDNNGGQIRFTESGFYELVATVTDEIGQSYTFSDTIRIYPLPTAVITDDFSFRGQPFTSKENRKYHLNGSSSFAQDYYGPEIHTIDHSKDFWEIIPLDGQDALQHIKVADGAGELKSDMLLPSKYSKRDIPLNRDLLFKLEGRYKIRYQITNNYGKKSPITEEIITVTKDTAPIISFDNLDRTYRVPLDANLAEITAYDISSVSDDDDIIDIERIRYRFDSNNDGNFEDETWSEPITIDHENKRASVKVSHVGRYQFEFYSKDQFGQETIDQFVTDDDRRRSYKYKEIEVDNIAPTVDFEVTPSNKVDIAFTVGNIERSKIQELNTKINTYLRTYLEANNSDLIDTKIEMIETYDNEISSEGAGASVIKDTWQVFQPSLYDRFQVVGNTLQAPNAESFAGFFDPDGFESTDVSISADISTIDPGQAFGLLFRIDKRPDGKYDYYFFSNSATYNNWNYSASWIVKVTGHDLLNESQTNNGGPIPWVYNGPRTFNSYIEWNQLYDFPFHVNTKDENGIRIIPDGINKNQIKQVFTHVPFAETVEILDYYVYNYPTEASISENVTYNFKVTMEGNNIKAYRGRNLIIDCIDENPITKGSYGFGNISNRGTTYSNVLIEAKATKIKSLDEALRDTTWREDSARFLVNLTDVTLPELQPTSPKYSPILSRFLNDELYFSQLGTNATKAQAESFINANDGKGKWFRNDDANMDEGLQRLAVWILDTVKSQKKSPTKYILLDELVNYKVFYNDLESDPKFDGSDRWKYHHNHLYYHNSLGRTNFHEQWMNESINKFDKVGKFTVEYRVRDNPVGTDDRFDNYRKWSSMLNGPLDLFVHRKPIASFKANITKNASTFNISYTDNSYDIDHQNRTAGYYKLDENNNIITSNAVDGVYVQDKGIVEREWQWREVGQTTWNNGQITSGATTKEYLVRLRVRDMDGPDFEGVWSDWEVVLITNNPQPPIAQFNLSHRVLPLSSNMIVTDTSYDPNGDPINGWRWTLTKISGGRPGTTGTYEYSPTLNHVTLNSVINNRINAEGIGEYRLSLQVKDNTGVWGNPLSTSEIYSQEFKVIPVNLPPIADFNIQRTGSWRGSTFAHQPTNQVITVFDPFITNTDADSGYTSGSKKKWNSSYSDPDSVSNSGNDGNLNTGFTTRWKLERFIGTDLTVIGNNDAFAGERNFSGDIPFTGSFENQNLDYGAYRVTFSVTDKPKVPPYEVSDALTTNVIKNIYVLPKIDIVPSYSPVGGAINTKTITLKGTTENHVTKVEVEFLGQSILLDMTSQVGSIKTWEKSFTIPANNTLFGDQVANFKAYNNYANVGDNYYVERELIIPVKPLLTIKGDYRGEPITGETITLIAETSDSATSVNVEFMGDNMVMSLIPPSEISNYYSDSSPDKKYWRADYTISDTITESKYYPAKFTARDDYGQTAIDIIDIYVIALRLINFRITDIVNHPHHSFPLTRIDFPADYKAGYRVTYRINAIGNPNNVTARIYANTSFEKEVNMINVGSNGNETIWEGTYFSNPRLEDGSLIRINLKGYKGMTVYDYNFRESWNDGGTLGSDITGNILRVNGAALQDGRINRTN